MGAEGQGFENESYLQTYWNHSSTFLRSQNNYKWNQLNICTPTLTESWFLLATYEDFFV